MSGQARLSIGKLHIGDTRSIVKVACPHRFALVAASVGVAEDEIYGLIQDMLRRFETLAGCCCSTVVWARYGNRRPDEPDG